MNQIVSNNKKNDFREILKNLSAILGILTILMSGLVIVYRFLVYLFEIQLFNYWSIDYSFYNNKISIIDDLMFDFVIVCIGVFFCSLMISVRNKKLNNLDKIKYWFAILSMFAVCYIILGLKEFLKFNFNFSLIIIHTFCLIIAFVCLMFFSKKLENFYSRWKENKNNEISSKNIITEILIFINSLFVSVIILGFVNVYVNKDYKIIMNDSNQCNVILYSTKDYYIVADCKIDDKNLTVYNSETQRKIDNYNIISKWKKFEKIIKF